MIRRRLSTVAWPGFRAKRRWTSLTVDSELRLAGHPSPSPKRRPADS
jgi:hypothetical protein